MALQIRDDARLAGLTLRYHTWPHSRPQTVAEHSWQLCRILLSICPPDVSATLLPHAVVHDLGEISVGDPPYPVKIQNPEYGAMHKEIEARAVEELCEAWFLPPPLELDAELRWTFKLAEFIEMWEWGLEEMIRGNQFAELVGERCWAVVQKMLREPPSEVDVSETLELATLYVDKRASLWHE